MQAQEQLSRDSVDPSAADTIYSTVPEENLNMLKPAGMPPHRLLLKVGAPIILLRNLHKESGLMNGTRLFVRALGSRVIEALIVTGSHAGQVALIPTVWTWRLQMTPSHLLSGGVSFLSSLLLPWARVRHKVRTLGLLGCTCRLHASPMGSYMLPCPG